MTSSSVEYHVTECRTDEGTHEDTVAKLRAGDYSVFFFALKNDGLPAVQLAFQGMYLLSMEVLVSLCYCVL